jgi:hypothetical protein
MMRKAPSSSRLLQTPAILGGAVFFILALPVILPFVGVLHWRDKRRLHAAAKRLACQDCGQLLGERAVAAADVAWAARIERLRRRLPASIRFRVVRDLDAICTHCGARYEFMPQTREFVALKRAP